MKQHYQALELPQNASPRRIKEQYRRLAKRYHPDLAANPADQVRYANKFKEINNAYAALSEVVKRASLKPKERKLDFLYQTSQTLLKQKQWSKALIILNEIMAIDSSYRDTLTWLRETRRKQKKLAHLYNTANVLFKQQNWAEAMSGFEAIVNEDPNYRDSAKKLKKARRARLMKGFMGQR